MTQFTVSRLAKWAGSLLACASVLATPSAQAQSWSQGAGGFQGGNVRALFVPSLNSTTASGDSWTAVYYGGMFKQAQGSSTWTPINNGLTDKRVFGFAVASGASPYRGYAATRGSGVFKTTDGGANWTAVNNGLNCAYVRAVSFVGVGTGSGIGTASTDRLLASTDCGSNGGVYLSSDGGANWTATSGMPAGVLVNSVTRVNPVVPGTSTPSGIDFLLAATYDGVYKSTDNGLNWTLSNGAITSANGANINNVTFLYNGSPAALTIYATEANTGVWKSTDNGASWGTSPALNKITTGGVFTDGNGNGNLYFPVDGEGMYKSADRGATWSLFVSSAALPGVRSFNRNTTVNGSPIFYAQTFAGLHQSSDGGVSWNKTSAGLPGGYTVNGDFDSAGDPYVAAAEGVYKPSPTDDTFQRVGGHNLGFFGNGGHVIVTPANVPYAITSNLGVFKYDGSNWVAKNAGLPVMTRQGGQLRSDPNNANGLYLGLNRGGMYYSNDGGESWSGRNTGLTGGARQVIHMAVTATQALIATNAGLYKSTDTGATWTRLPFAPKNPANVELPIDHLRIDSGNGTIYAAVYETDAAGVTFPGSGIWKSTDGGATWTQSLAGKQAHDIGIARTASGVTLYAGLWDAVGGGAWQSTDEGATWTAINAGLTSNYISSFAIDDGVLQGVATLGDGVFGYSSAPAGTGTYSAWKFSGAVQDAGQTYYGVSYGANDPQQLLASVSISGSGQTVNALYWQSDNSWHADMNFGTTQPSLANAYIGTYTPKTGAVSTVTFQIDRFSTAFPSNLQPSGGQNVTAAPVFSWTPPTGTYNYKVDLSAATGGGVLWSASNTATGVAYNGPPLVPGTTYRFHVTVSDFDSVTQTTHGAGRVEYFCFQCAGASGANYDQIFIARNRNLPGGGENFSLGVRYPRQANDQLKSAVLACPGAASSSYTFSGNTSAGNEWGPSVSFGNTEPATPINCTSTVTYMDGTINSKAVTLDRFSPANYYVTNISLQPNENVTSGPVVTWSAPTGTPPASGFVYQGNVFTSNFSSQLWFFGYTASTQASYSGTSLTANSGYMMAVTTIEGTGTNIMHAAQTWIPFCFQCSGTVTTSSTTTTSTTGTTTSTTVSTTTTTIAGTANSPTLVPGWNLVGNGLSTALDVAASFGDPSKVSTVWKWMAAAANWAFYTPTLADGGAAYAAGKGYAVLTSIASGEGFWVNAKAALTVPLAGPALLSTSYQAGLPSGWSLIAIGDKVTPSGFNRAISTSPPSPGVVPLNLTTIWAWDAALLNWYFYAPSLESNGGLSAYVTSKSYLDFGTNTLEPGMGFWVNKP